MSTKVFTRVIRFICSFLISTEIPIISKIVLNEKKLETILSLMGLNMHHYFAYVSLEQQNNGNEDIERSVIASELRSYYFIIITSYMSYKGVIEVVFDVEHSSTTACINI